MTRRTSVFFVVAILFSVPAHGASIDWGPVQSTTSSAADDIVDGGDVVLAINGRSQPNSSSRRPPSSVILDGIEFESASIRSFLGQTAIDSDRALSLINSTGDPDYDAFLTHVAFANVSAAGLSRSDDHVIYPIRGLARNADYFVQLWYTDERPSEFNSASRIAIFGDNEQIENTVAVPGEGQNGFGSFVVGSFTTQRPLQNVSLRITNASRSHLTGILVREAPECSPGTGDFDNDGQVDFPDFLVLSENFGFKRGPAQGDINCNRTVDFPDFLVLSQNFGKPVNGVQTVPEPNDTLTWLALLSMPLLRRSRSRRPGSHA